ncbi:trypsin-7-like [Ischnura elegans]|uniref:trypsin-7-like n=1 Tax=Ischnura elegans TaxID=197161 RepID=UPI001ED8A4A9|nr:trypsin-7-like [Ischnura elegans]
MFFKTTASIIFLASLCMGFPERNLGWKKDTSWGRQPHGPYIVGGDVVQGREYPSQVSIRYNDKHICGGTILGPDWILTAAQCGKGYQRPSMSVVAGSNTLNEGGSKHDVLEIIIHEDYSEEQSWRNDLCVMKVTPAIILENGTSAVTLATDTQDPPSGSSAMVVGWGLEETGGTISNDLRKAVIPIVDRPACQADYENEKEIYDEQICAGGMGDKDACNGDAGGPLFLDEKQVGIISWGKPCAQSGYPTVFTEVSHYTEWIKHHIQL